MVHRMLVVMALGGLTPGALAVPVTLQVQPGGHFDVRYVLNVGPSLSTTVSIGGDLTLDLVPAAAGLDAVRFLGGNVTYSDTREDIILATFPGVTRVEIRTQDVVSSLLSEAGAGAIDPITGVLSNLGHRHHQDRGSVRTQYWVSGLLGQEETRDLAQDPDRNPLFGESRVTLQPIEDLGYRARHQVLFHHERDETRSLPAPFVGATLTIQEVGSFSAIGEVDLPGAAMIDWAVAELGQRPLTLDDRCARGGQPVVLRFAFRAAGAGWQPPVDFRSSPGQVRLTLPAEGLRAPVQVEYSPDLGPDSWVPWPGGAGQTAIFGVGESGVRALDVPTGPRGFLRLGLAE